MVNAGGVVYMTNGVPNPLLYVIQYFIYDNAGWSMRRVQRGNGSLLGAFLHLYSTNV